jgi:hypothetical protein
VFEKNIKNLKKKIQKLFIGGLIVLPLLQKKHQKLNLIQNDPTCIDKKIYLLNLFFSYKILTLYLVDNIMDRNFMIGAKTRPRLTFISIPQPVNIFFSRTSQIIRLDHELRKK